jgi:hypothetical protein
MLPKPKLQRNGEFFCDVVDIRRIRRDAIKGPSGQLIGVKTIVKVWLPTLPPLNDVSEYELLDEGRLQSISFTEASLSSDGVAVCEGYITS